MKPYCRLLIYVVAVMPLYVMANMAATADEPTSEGGWLVERDEQSGISVHTMEMTLYPQAEPRPALRYRLIPDDFDMVDGNAAIYYLKAMGFLEQNAARDKLSEFSERSLGAGSPGGQGRQTSCAWGVVIS